MEALFKENSKKGLEKMLYYDYSALVRTIAIAVILLSVFAICIWSYRYIAAAWIFGAIGFVSVFLAIFAFAPFSHVAGSDQNPYTASSRVLASEKCDLKELSKQMSSMYDLESVSFTQKDIDPFFAKKDSKESKEPKFNKCDNLKNGEQIEFDAVNAANFSKVSGSVYFSEKGMRVIIGNEMLQAKGSDQDNAGQDNSN